MRRAEYWFRELLFPRKCMLCGTLLEKDEMDLCRCCRTNTPQYPFGTSNPPPKGKNRLHFLDSFTAIWYYKNDVRSCIHRYKFRRALHLAPKFGRLLAMKLLKDGPEEFDILTWVPVSRIRRLKRGYDQSELLAREVGRELDKRPRRLLCKVRNTPPQSGILKDSERKANVLGVYRIQHGEAIAGKRILLLDDILTTGSTAGECARMLLTAGAKEVHCAVVAAARKEE